MRRVRRLRCTITWHSTGGLTNTKFNRASTKAETLTLRVNFESSGSLKQGTEKSPGVGWVVGTGVGDWVGTGVGEIEGSGVGFCVGLGAGCAVMGAAVGAATIYKIFCH